MAESSPYTRKPLHAHSTKAPHVTSIGAKHFPKNKHKRRQFGKHLYRGQGAAR